VGLTAHQFSRPHFMTDGTSGAPREARIGAEQFLNHPLEPGVLGRGELVTVSVMPCCRRSIFMHHIRLVSR